MISWFVVTVGWIVATSLEAEGGFIGVLQDHVVQEKVDDDEVDGGSRNRSFPEDAAVGYYSEDRAGSSDIAIPLLTGVVVKVLTLLPLILTTLALIAGFSLAASKVALLLGGGLALYYYLNDNKLLLGLPVTTKGLDYHHQELPVPHLPQQYSPPELEEYVRDRADAFKPFLNT